MNILLIIADALRPDRMGCYGYSKNTTPFMDTLAKEGMIWRNCISNCNHTMPGLITIFTGVYQVIHGIDSQKAYSIWDDSWIKGKLPFELLKENGYIIAGCDPHVYGKTGYSGEVKDVISSLEEHKNEKFFIWYRPETTHLPYDPEPPYDKMFFPDDYVMSSGTKSRIDVVKKSLIVLKKGLISKAEIGSGDAIEKPGYERTVGIADFIEEDIPAINALYDGEVRTLDDEIRSYVTKLDELGLKDNTLIIITSDHGEQLMERGAVGHSSCSLEGNLYDENIKIPLILWCPGTIPGGTVREQQISQADIMPCIFDILGFVMPAWIEGRRDEAFAMTQNCGWQKLDDDIRMIWCIRTLAKKLIYYYDPENNGNRFEFFDLIEDPRERNNIYRRDDPEAIEYKKKLYAWIRSSRYGDDYYDMLDR